MRVPEQLKISANESLDRLIEGNRRFAANKTIGPHRGESRRLEIVKGQKPYAIILGCVDSRVPPELIFDQGLGDLFVIRSAGQVIDDAILGSIEFGVAELGIPLIMVLGHTRCGAVTATVAILEKNLPVEGAIGALVEAIKPAVDRSKGHGEESIDQAARKNVALEINRLKASPVLSEAIKAGNTKIVGAFYDLSTGLVEIMALKQHEVRRFSAPHQDKHHNWRSYKMSLSPSPHKTEVSEFHLSDDVVTKINQVAASFPDRNSALIPALHLIQDQFGWVPPPTINQLAQLLKTTPNKIYGVLTFYTMFNLKPVGTYHIQVCRNVSCSLLGAKHIIEHLSKKLKIQPGETTEDKKFTLSLVECLGACGTAPVMMINDTFYENLDAKKVDTILKSLQ